VGILREVEVQRLAPAEHGEGIGISHRKAVAEQIGLLRQLFVEPGEALFQPVDDRLLAVVRHRLVEQPADALVQFGGDEIQRLHGAVALH
jgi:hypothetical protein